MDKKTVLALGYFDGVHLGHREVILKAKELALKNASTLTVLTFKGDLKKAVSGVSQGCIYTYKEKERLLYSLGADYVVGLSVSKNFLKRGKLSFLNYLNKRFNVAGYVFGTDYKFGKNLGNADYLKDFAKKHGQAVFVVNPVLKNSEKVSSTLIKELLSAGEIKKANALLNKDYFLTGKVYNDRSVGKSIGFPTANLVASENKFLLKRGVYSGYAYLNGEKYKAVINYGERPTFNLSKSVVEAHFIGFSGNLYGKEIILYFTDYLREINKFSTLSELTNQIEKDVLRVKKAND